MLPHSKRLSIALFSKVIQEGGVCHTPLLSVFTVKAPGISRFSVSVPKKVIKSAVGRNKMRRRVYSILRSLEKRIIPEIQGVIVMKKGSEKLTFALLAIEVEKTFVKSRLLK